MTERLHAVVVTYHPDLALLERQRTALQPQVAFIHYCDNTADGALERRLGNHEGLEVLTLPENLGVGAALNRGIERALAQGATHVLTFDQDSVPAPDMVERLLEPWRGPLARRLAATAPVTVDAYTGEIAPLIGLIHPWYRRPRLYLRHGDTAALDHAITSGLMISAERWHQVGPLREDFFIDYIDIEWSLRARALGLTLLGVGAARLEHRLGERSIALPFGRKAAVHGPRRTYYEVRNGLIVHRLPHADPAWRLWHAWIGLKKLVFYLLAFPQRRERLRAIVKGVNDARLLSSTRPPRAP